MLIYKVEAQWKHINEVNSSLWIGHIIIGRVLFKESLRRSTWEAEIVGMQGGYAKLLDWNYKTKEVAMEAIENYYEITEEENT